MPKIVDHNERRSEIAEVTLRAIKKHGVENATVRVIAREGGFSSGVLAHYFTNKEELIGFAFDWVAQRDFAQIEARAKRRKPGIERLRVPLELMLPRSDEEVGAAISLSFWGHAVSNAWLAEKYREQYARWREFICDYIAEAQSLGEFKSPAPIDELADLLIAAVDGLCVGITLDRQRFPIARQKRLLSRLIAITAASSA